VSPWKSAMRFGKRGKLSPHYIGPFKILARVGPVAYTLELPEELKGIHKPVEVVDIEVKRLKQSRIPIVKNERVERDLYWTRVQAHEFNQEMIHRGFVFEERPNKAINDSVDAAIAVERARQANVRNDASGSGPARGQDAAPVVYECTFAGFMKCNLAVFRGVEGAVKLRRWFKKTKRLLRSVNVQRARRMVEPERVKVDAYIRGLMDKIKGGLTSSKPADLNQAVLMAHKLMENKSQARDARILEGKKRNVQSSVTSVERLGIRMATMEKLVEKLGNTKDKVECKKLKKELKEARIMPPKSAPMNQAAIRRMIKDSVDAAIAAERARQANVRNDASGSGPTRGAVELRRWFEKTERLFEISECAEGKKVKFAAATLEGPALTWWKTKNLKVKEYDVVAYTQMFNELSLTCPRMVEPERVKVDAYIRGLTDNIKGEVTSSKPADLNEAVLMAHKLMEQKSQARDAKILEGKKRK
nr:hypothetical protein [Tanacetum cinerariifolium]